MDFVTSSEPVVRLALTIGITSIALTVVMMVLTFTIHTIQVVRERRNSRILEKWRPILTRSIEGVALMVPPLKKSETLIFLNLWLHLQESLTGAAKNNLNTLARRTGVDATARRMLVTGGIHQRLMAITTLGHLRDKDIWSQLIPIAESENSFLSLAAARAMIQIDPRSAMRILTPSIAARTDWASSRIISVLKEAGPDEISAPLGAAALQAPAHQAPRLIRYLNAIHSDYAMETVGIIMRTSEHDEVIAACLEMLRDPRDVELARAFIGHPNWRIRVQAATTLGRIGTAEDVQILVIMLNDKEWWVRYKAALALADLPFAGMEKLKEIEATTPDPAVKDVLRHVIGELEPA